MKKYPLFIVLLTLFGCGTISYEHITQPSQRIVFEGFSFFPPNGDKWEVTSAPLKLDMINEVYGPLTVKIKGFKRSFVGPKQTPNEEELWKVAINKWEFGNMKFDHGKDLLGWVESWENDLGKWQSTTLPPRPPELLQNKEWVQSLANDLSTINSVLLESSYSYEKWHGMDCVRKKITSKGDQKISSSSPSAVNIYSKGYFCVHPRHSNHLIELVAEQFALKNQIPTTTEFQSEIDPLFNSLEVLSQSLM